MLAAFADEADYIAAFGSSGGRTSDDLDAASAKIRGICRWHIWPQVTETFVLDGTGGPALMLPTQHLTAVLSVSEIPYGGVSGVLTVADLEWSAAGYLYKAGRRCWTPRARGVTVQVTHGYSEVPADIVQLTLDLAYRAGSNPAGMYRRRQVGQRADDYASPDPYESQLSGLDPYRRRI